MKRAEGEAFGEFSLQNLVWLIEHFDKHTENKAKLHELCRMHGIFNEEAIKKSHDLIEGASRIVITTHKSPDGDAIGSAFALFHLLRNRNKNVQVVLPDRAPDFLQWVDNYSSGLIFQENTEKSTQMILEADLIFSLDYNNLSRTGPDMEAVLRKAAAQKIMIDHHHQPETLFAVSFSDTTICSTCQLIYEWADAMKYTDAVNTSVASCIYMGIMTDSGSFRFPSVTPKTHEIVASLMELGIDHAAIHRNVYDNNLVNRLKLVGFALSEKLEVLEGCGTALISLRKSELEKYSYQPGDTEGLVNQALSIQGIKLAAFFREGNNEIKVSLRSVGTFDVNQYARKSWSGGGHKNAAGGRSIETLDEALERFRKEVETIKNDIIIS
jgi:phosphoesterase RecJ-like protein